MRKLLPLVIAFSLMLLLPPVFAGGNNTSVTASIGGGTGNPLIIDITVKDPDGLSHVIISSTSATGDRIRVTDNLSPRCPTSETYRIDRDSTSETYDVGVMDCGNPPQSSITSINADGSSDPTQYNPRPVVGVPAGPVNRLELLLPYIGSALAVIGGAVFIVYVARSERAEPKD